jgi:G-patch domain
VILGIHQNCIHYRVHISDVYDPMCTLYDHGPSRNRVVPYGLAPHVSSRPPSVLEGEDRPASREASPLLTSIIMSDAEATPATPSEEGGGGTPAAKNAADDDTTTATSNSTSAGIRFQISGSTRRTSGRREGGTGGGGARSDVDGFGRHDDAPPTGFQATTTTGATSGGIVRRDATTFTKEETSADGKAKPVIPVKPNTRLTPGSVAKEEHGGQSGGPEDVVRSRGVRRTLPEAVPSDPGSSGAAAPVVESISFSAREAEQYKRQVMELPDEPTIDDYQRNEAAIPISQFGAALLRGMGWKGDDDENDDTVKKRDEEAAMPRPHRLGLGAIPKAAAMPENNGGGGAKASSTTTSRPRRPDQVRQDERLKRQLAEFASQRKERIAQDRQAVLQDGSVVYLENLVSGNHQRGEYRARIVQLAGVPGLNKVKVELEHEEDGHGDYGRHEVIVNRRDIGALVSREDLSARPFETAPANPATLENERGGRNKRSRESHNSNDESDRHESSRKGTSKGRRSHSDDEKRSDHDSHDDPESRRRDKKKRKESQKERGRDEDRSRKDRRAEKRDDRRDPREDAWLIPHIRVRVATSKYGQRHLQQKGVVVDVTPKGATIQMDDSRSTLLDLVPARHLTTALPKAGGCAIVVQGEHRRAMGTVLQRDSRVAVLQLDEDHSVLTLPLDDLAEWCGPRGDE